MSSENPAFGLSLAQLRDAYLSGATTPTRVIAGVLAQIEQTRDNHAWICVADLDDVIAQAQRLEASALAAGGFDNLPLYGVPLAVKDNIDVAGFPTTNACPDFAYQPERSATAVQRAIDAGAIVVGKTNLDQFATGLVGVRSPYGIPESVFGQGMVSGGSSSGSALAVATGIVPVALATDTAGSGRVPAALNGIIGIKPTLGLVSTLGLQPACRTIDGITVMGRQLDDALALLSVIVGPDPENPWGRDDAELSPAVRDAPVRLGLPAVDSLEFFGDEPMRQAHLAARESAIELLDAVEVDVDLEPFLEAGGLLYQGAWVAERLADLGDFLAEHPVSTHPDSVHPVVRSIIESGSRFSAADAFRTQHRLRNLRHTTGKVWDDIDALLLPTIGTTFTIDEVLADPIARNAVLGHYTHFTNLLDLAALTIPVGTTTDGRPVALMLIGPPRSDLTLAAIAATVLSKVS
ncbi:MAG TPA: allophanate hydrolase [Kineosporiaceae bacterium]|nr:allophanate hydrolase [Kineosporiaceae bacterium]